MRLQQKMILPRATLLLKVQRPIVYVSSIEKSLGTSKPNQQLTNRIKNYLANAGFEFTDDKKKVQVKANVAEITKQFPMEKFRL